MNSLATTAQTIIDEREYPPSPTLAMQPMPFGEIALGIEIHSPQHGGMYAEAYNTVACMCQWLGFGLTRQTEIGTVATGA